MNVGRIIARQAERAHLVGKTQAAIVLHGAGLGGVRLRVGGGAGLVVE